MIRLEERMPTIDELAAVQVLLAKRMTTIEQDWEKIGTLFKDAVARIEELELAYTESREILLELRARVIHLENLLSVKNPGEA